jgi:hypothetical protein
MLMYEKTDLDGVIHHLFTYGKGQPVSLLEAIIVD